ncbi:hypothetical protein B5M47_00260 [candidate division CPR3 bacterium 4484_211]|uniref:Spore protein YkvP/CgeB glycosyl transferase-like domain-containing protein n=1 Tax=candidate division CPR3 bacterium 4484_211 TaxID=1968527 RepID=A0A1W9NZV7_UNCC3|nr:MAG: hypothetical protein B5M47_00260 [candidate division CPR3 bacterium 4484_211]
MKLLFGYGYTQGTTPFYYERAFRRLGDTTTCGPSDNPGRQQDIPCEFNADIQQIIRKVKADCFILFPEGNFFLPQNIEKITIPKILILSDSFINFHWHRYYASLFDLVFVAQKEYADKLKRLGIKKTYWLPNACDPKIHRNFHLERIYDIGFVGVLNNTHNPRRSLYLKALASHFNVKIASNVWLENMAKIYSQSKIIFNISGARDLNMRVFEALSCGGLLLTDYIPNGLLNLFKDRKHCVVYHSLKEAVTLAKYYLKHSRERKQIAGQGQKEVWQKHTYSHRARLVISRILDLTRNNPGTGNNANQMTMTDIKLNLLRSYFFINHPLLKTQLIQLTSSPILINKKLPFYQKTAINLIRIFTTRLSYQKRKILLAMIKKLEKRRIAELIKWCYYQLLLRVSN